MAKGVLLARNYSIVQIRLKDGERLPILLNKDTGVPLHLPNLYASTILRPSNLSYRTLEVNLQSICHIYIWGDINNIDVENRFVQRSYFGFSEIDSLIDFIAKPLIRNKKVIKINNKVKNSTKFIKSIYLLKYFCWLENYYNFEFGINTNNKFALLQNSIKERIKLSKNKPLLSSKKGLNPEEFKLLKLILYGNSNHILPWKSKDIIFRNLLIMKILLELGIRRGELLQLKISDLNLRKCEILIKRSPDDPDDTRTVEPNTKTRDRILHIRPGLSENIEQYIMQHRPKGKNARSHEYLITGQRGSPLTLAAVNLIFRQFRNGHKQSFKFFTPHTLRHTWNDLFSHWCEKNSISAEKEIKLRAYLQGWSEFSSSANIYTRRYVEEEAIKTLLSMSKNL